MLGTPTQTEREDIQSLDWFSWKKKDYSTPGSRGVLVFVGSDTEKVRASCRQGTTRTSGSMALSQCAEPSLGFVIFVDFAALISTHCRFTVSLETRFRFLFPVSRRRHSRP